MRIWKVYAQCCIAVHPIKDVTDYAHEVIDEAITANIDIMLDNGQLEFPEDYEEAIDSIFGEAYEKLMAEYERTDQINAGDWCVIRSEEMPNRPRICGYEVI